ncbi:copper ion binding [Striga asiatica]|uniref:Copper ion binding n=1 Tax=Striga asiatica TaxID=4170 RepID=A0A5A7QG63_STRAF|nr:copper ion binding [Striga asiatica]
MAFATRLLSRSIRQVYSGQSVMRPECVVAARSFAKGAGNSPPALKGDDPKNISSSQHRSLELNLILALLDVVVLCIIPKAKLQISLNNVALVGFNFDKSLNDLLPKMTFSEFLTVTHSSEELLKGIFLEVKKKFETAIGVIRKEKITIDPDNPAAVAEYAKVMKTAREKANLFSESERIKYTIESQTQDIPDARSYLLALKDIRVKRGLVDELGAEAMMMDALDKVEKELKNPLLRNDKKGMALLKAEFDKVNQKLGIRREDLPKYEEQLELKIAKAQLEELKKDAVEAMETQKKRDEFKDEELPDVKSLDIRNFI